MGFAGLLYRHLIGSIGDRLGGGWWLYSRPLKDSATGVEVRLITVRLITVKTDPLEEPINELNILELGGQRYLKYPNDGIVEKEGISGRSD